MNRHRNVCIYLALLIPATLLGFWETYFRLLPNLPETMAPQVHAHAVLMFLWVIMLIAQAWLIRTNRFAAHRWVGRSSYVIAPLVILSGLAVVHGVFNQEPVGTTIEEVYRLHVLAFGMVVAFAVTWGLAILYRRRTPLHVRFMVSTAFAVATAIAWRIFYFQVPGCGSDEAAVVGNGLVLGGLLVVLIATDWRSGVKRSAFWVVAVLLGVAHLGYWTFARTDGYFAFCRWFGELPK